MKYNKLSSFIIKIIAIVTMVFDHVGIMFSYYSINDTAAYIFRAIGRLSLPLFVFMVVEGVIHTKSFSKYCLKLGIIGTIVLIAQIILHYSNYTIIAGNIFIDLLLGALMVKALMSEKKGIKYLALIPLLIGLASFIFYSLDNVNDVASSFFPFYLRPQYHIYSLLLIFGFYEAYKLSKVGFSIMGLDYELYKDGPMDRMVTNGIQAGMLIVITTLLYVVGIIYNTNIPSFVFWDYPLQNFAMISSAFLLLYSGQRGYNAKWFQYGAYIFYPLHIVLLYVIFGLIFGL